MSRTSTTTVYCLDCHSISRTSARGRGPGYVPHRKHGLEIARWVNEGGATGAFPGSVHRVAVPSLNLPGGAHAAEIAADIEMFGAAGFERTSSKLPGLDIDRPPVRKPWLREHVARDPERSREASERRVEPASPVPRGTATAPPPPGVGGLREVGQGHVRAFTPPQDPRGVDKETAARRKVKSQERDWYSVF
jgi:hypothetical protein